MTRRIRTVVVDDEPLARRGLCVRLEREADVEIVREAEDGPSAVEAILAERPDLVYLDVQMPGFDGFEVVARCAGDHLPAIVFVTAYDRYALRAFVVHALDYLLKPITHRRFQDSLRRVRAELDRMDRAASADRLRALLEARASDDRPSDLGVRPAGLGAPDASPADAAAHTVRITVRDGDRYVLLRASDLDWAEADANYLKLHAGPRTFHVRMTMQELERRLDPAHFARIHRSTIVNLDRVSAIHPEWHGDFSVVLTTGATLRLSRRYRSRVLA
jgi:two-component system LytT family response regulator